MRSDESSLPPKSILGHDTVREPQPGDLTDALRIARYARKRAEHANAVLGRDPDPQNPADEGEGLLGRVAGIENLLGDSGDPVRKRPPSGLVGGYLQLSSAVESFTEELRLDRESRERWYKRIGIVVMALTTAAAVGGGNLVWQWVSTLKH